jgi:8-oxo-dGTP diphosphatase
MKKLVHVAVGVIFDCPPDKQGVGKDQEKILEKDKILIAKRADHQHQGGLWEFPGGKVESGESVQVALQRELEEELGLQCSIEDMRPLITIPFHYPDKSVLLDVWSVYNGKLPNTYAAENEFIGKEDQLLAWVEQAELASYAFPKANKAILDALLLPQKIVITQDDSDPDVILAQVANTLKNHCSNDNSATCIQLRASSLDQMQYTQLAMKLYGICHEAGSLLIWNCPLEWYQVAFADGLHLSVNNFNAAKLQHNARPIPANQWLSMACHNLAELESVQALADTVLVSPVKKTTTHTNSIPLTWAGFKAICDQARIPCYALGGLDISDVEMAIQQGGQGIAGISCFISK